MLRRGCKRQRVGGVDTDVLSATAAVDEANDEFADVVDDAAVLVDDTLAAIDLLASRSAAGFNALELPPFVLQHQLYTVFPNRTFVDQNIHRLRSAGAIVTFRVPTGVDEVAVLRTAAYQDELDRWLRVLRAQRERPQQADPNVGHRHDALARFVRVLPGISAQPSILARVLVEEMEKRRSPTAPSGDAQTTEDDIVWLQRLGFLRQTARLDDDVFQLSVPGVGALVSAVKKTRTALLATLKRMRYKEAAEAQLRKTPLKHSRLGWDYHLADMEGRGLIRRTKVTSGTLVAVAQP
ncbi:hypothetical protein PybrP1_007788 [[Pythium] brassicae (nom. inval.)]|nr:hypothetical protein PybrP1_007788 [[Pythium] brassicae (nom. inval.)]